MDIIKETPKRKVTSDWLGVVCSLGCAIHCAAMPILLSVLPSLTAVKWMADPLFHQVVAVLCAIIVLRAILPAWRQHRSRAVAGLAVGGVTLLAIAAFILPDECCSPTSAVTATSPQSDSLRGTDSANVASEQTPVPTRLASFQLTGASQAAESRSEAGHEDCAFCRRHQEHAATYSRPLFTAEQLESRFGPAVSQRLVSWQPYLSPLGGVLLILGHLLNIRLQVCGCGRGGCGKRSPVA